jgi:hypothetical protein
MNIRLRRTRHDDLKRRAAADDLANLSEELGLY